VKHLPYAFTEHGAIQAANVLSSPRAVTMGIHVVRAFVQLRDLLASYKERRRCLLNSADRSVSGCANEMVPGTGLEPVRSCLRGIFVLTTAFAASS
jgi:hypothetical protein